MMTDKLELIDKQAFKNILQDRHDKIFAQGDCLGSIAGTIHGVILLLDTVPTISLEESKSHESTCIHAHWIKCIDNAYKCSKCGHVTGKFLPGFHPTYPYCYCGAKMDEMRVE